MNARFLSTKVVRLTLASLLACGLLALVALSLSGTAVNAAPLRSYPAASDDLQLRWITVTASEGVIVSDTHPGEAPTSGSKTVYFRNFAAGTITVTPDVTGTAPLTFGLSSGFTINTFTFVTSTAAPLNNQSIGDGLTPAMVSKNIAYTAANNDADVITFTINYVRDILSPTGGIVLPLASAVLTRSAQPTYTIVMTAADSGSGIKSVQVITGAGGAAQTGFTYDWALPTEDNVAHTLLMTATDYVDNSVTVTRLITVDTQAPSTTGVVFTPSHAINTWLPASTVAMTWTGFSDASGVGSYTYLWDSSADTIITPGINVSSTGNTTASQLLSTTGNYYFHVAALDTHGNWSGTVVTGPFKIDAVVPTSGSVSINNGALNTNQVTVTLTVSATDDTSGLNEMAFSNDGTAWLTYTYATSATWTLSTGDGAKTVYAQLRDAAANMSATPYTATIFLDRIAPQVTLTLPRQISATQVVAVWTGFDPGEPITGSGIYSYSLGYVRDDGTSAQQLLSATVTTTSVPVIGEHTYTFTLGAYDKAGNYTTTQQIPLRVGQLRVYLPIVVYKYNNYWWSCTPVDVEPNNDYAHAQSLTNWSNISGGQELTVSGNFCPPRATPSDDQTDYFKITPTNGSLALKLSVPAGTNLNLYGYDQSGTNLVFSASVPAGNKSVEVPLPAGSGAPYYLEVRRMDAVINQYHAQPYTLEVSDLFKTLTNGSFEDGAGNTVTDWTLSNAGLPAAPVTSMQDGTALFGNRAILLGDPAMACKLVPIGYAEAKQTFFVPNVSQSLSLKYRYVIFTQDAPGTDASKYDRFEVYVQNPSTPVASDGNGINPGSCNAFRRVPGAENPRPQDGAWAVNSISLDAYKGQFVTVFFRNYSRPDNLFNTYTYLDKVELVSP